MKWTSDYSLEKIFLTKEIILKNEEGMQIIMKIPTIADHILHPEINIFNNIINSKKSEMIKFYQTLTEQEIKTELQLCWNIMLKGYLKELQNLATAIRDALSFFFNSEVILSKGKIVINESFTLEEDFFNYMIYVLRKSEGMKVEPPRTFSSEADRQKYLKQLEQEEKIRQIRANGTNLISNGKQGGDKSFLNIFNMIIQAYPQYKFEDLYQMTFEQIVYLQENAGKVLKYMVERSAYAAGNLKKLNGFWE